MTAQAISSKNVLTLNNPFIPSSRLPQSTGHEELDKAIELAGYSYDQKQDIFYSTLDPWQRHVGYCRLYDEAAAPLGMIIDCEPIFFEYLDRNWMIAFWKGQYDLVTGGEIGVYIEADNLTVPGFYHGFYSSVSNDDLLPMSFTLKKKDNVLFTRSEKHWWLTGFKLGEFSEPWELTMEIEITLQNMIMRDAFILGLKNAGYKDSDLNIDVNTVRLTFTKPHTLQPLTRNLGIDWIIQYKNRLLCEKYQELTAPYSNFEDKVKAIEELDPNIYKKVLKMGKTSSLYETFISILLICTFLLGHLESGIGKAKQLLPAY